MRKREESRMAPSSPWVAGNVFAPMRRLEEDGHMEGIKSPALAKRSWRCQFSVQEGSTEYTAGYKSLALSGEGCAQIKMWESLA